MADAPYSVVLAVPKDSPIKTAEDLKGKTISISSNGSLTHWLGQELSRGVLPASILHRLALPPHRWRR